MTAGPKVVWRPVQPGCPECRAIVAWRTAHPKIAIARRRYVALQNAQHKRLHGVRP